MPITKDSNKRSPHRGSQHTFSHYPDENVLHYYRWKSPPGVIKILSIIIIIMCVALFACVASTLAWDYMDNMGLGGLGGLGVGGVGVGGLGVGGMGVGGIGGGYYGSNLYGGGVGTGSYGYGGSHYMDPSTGKGFIIAIAAITFIAVLVIFILVISRQNAAKSPKFYLATLIICVFLAVLMLIASIVYLVAVNPMAQGSGSMMYNMMYQLCAQYQNPQQTSALLINQYMYHYCVVEPQEAIAIVLGFLVVVGLIIMMVFAIKTRSQINRYGRHRVLWEEPRSYNDGLSHGVEKWVTDVSEEPEAYLHDHNDQVGGARNYIDRSLDAVKPLYLPGDSDTASTSIMLKSPLRDYDTGAESADELDDAEYESEFPPIFSENKRVEYKRQFDRDFMEYKRLHAELEDINLGLVEVDRELNRLQEGSPQFLDAMDEYTRLKNLKKSSEYQTKKKRCKQLKARLTLVKRRLSDYEQRP